MEHLTTVRYWAALKDAAGTADEQVDASTLADALDAVRARHDDRFGQVLARCSLLVDGVQVGQRDHAQVRLLGGGEVDCLPPFAGG
ncbi:MAG TPA: MoaD/ThiS family protein [Mycobacteriales bacterium]|nr:MoaD/ThiS family protein [Mycobacteriales bacterium]